VEKIWNDVDLYFNQHLGLSDAILDAALMDSDAAGLPQIHITPTQGRLLQMLAQLTGARRILEIGTLAGYSTIWLDRALPPDGKLITLEFLEKHAEIARANIARAGLQTIVEIRQGKALDTLPVLATQAAGPFDLSFIDADKANNPGYFSWALKMSRPGSLIVVDNVVRDGAVVDAETRDPDIRGIRELIELFGRESRVRATSIQTGGSKGYDGLMIARVIS